ncbi:MAG: tRNA (cytidine(34)-2'-O)-methyltransferase [Candidatus Marinimicrobia bacterium]|jgi:tRNA (cytidine/uridine-2'-O-)-methyltransferase|nr:tRNA (cytidine(34)-2'-O)-methyltransferase [Candidatus Neomarinimicrobiota bacterium]MBT3501201.1 tRNA (cytidine(34)-2'-O)-methyltransferase [Candidatus Neomarinimicrobiota bacterium]MBT3839483.1 tRNA (cytidine(34)-2'-O)-methyltransferase [Candidatus Neomarinimicrobiota bacterium]MBT3999383.1 tRNA (cytidine(34)-2'-O)-methyltransferase [Candidatus Neomarinimicrobiota bacterium]MBT4282006.1 tRNA (cytidine(34)-2'-O)-methyltransferase [Candidatus Neomarinimicrobiota bacterium]
MFTIVLLEPQIPPNTGSTGRLCGATNTRLHVVGKLGFELSDRTLKRAGLDYWDYIDWEYFPDLDAYCENLIKKKTFHLLTTKSSKSYTSQRFQDGDYLVFGSETAGIDEAFLKRHWENTCTIPMENTNIRSLNLATSVGIVLYEAIRQVNET